MDGWVKLHRKIKEHWIFDKPEYLKAWICLLIEANHTGKKTLIEGEIIECGRGESVNSLKTWAGIFGKKWTVQRVRTFFNLLSEDGMIEAKGLRKTTRVTVCNYDAYQNQQHTDNTQVTRSQHTDNTQVTTNKKEKNVKNDKNDKNNSSKPKSKIDFVAFLKKFNEITGKKIRVMPEKAKRQLITGKKIRVMPEKAKRQLRNLLKKNSMEDVFQAIRNCKNDKFHKENPRFLTPEFITREDKFAKYLDYSPDIHNNKNLLQHDTDKEFHKGTESRTNHVNPELF